MKVLVSFSGGLDSTTLLAWLLNKGYSPTAISFKYGSKHNQYENEAARNLAKYYKVKLIELDISQAFAGIESSLMKTGKEVPEGYYTDSNMDQTVVPARNMIFLSIMTGIAASRGIPTLSMGIHSGDHFIYPDCRASFVWSMEKAVKLGSGNKVRLIRVPFIDKTKEQILLLGSYKLKAPVPYAFTRTCYKDQIEACGKCGSCVERLEAFEKVGLNDPIKYEGQK